MEGSGLTERLLVFPEGAARPREGSRVQGKAEGELWGTVNILRGLKHPKRHLEGSGGAHTHTHT